MACTIVWAKVIKKGKTEEQEEQEEFSHLANSFQV
jgi:hypothetical protein